MKWLRQALTKEDNKTYDGAYLALAAMIGMVGVTILSLIALGFVDMLSDYDNNFSYAGLGGGIAAIIAAVGAFMGAVGAYIRMDRTPPPGSAPPPAGDTNIDVKVNK